MVESQELRAAIYARVSSEQQAQQKTIDSQVAALEERVVEDGFVLDGELRFVDDGCSGSTLVRPALERLRDCVYAGGIDRLYVHSPDRLARKYAYQVLLLDELTHYGVEVVFLNHALGSLRGRPGWYRHGIGVRPTLSTLFSSCVVLGRAIRRPATRRAGP
jgi:site-specific DNA recombinase